MSGRDDSIPISITLYRAQMAPVSEAGFQPVSSFVDDVADLNDARNVTIIRQGGRGRAYKCDVVIEPARFLDAVKDMTDLLAILGPLPPGEKLYNHVHDGKGALIAAGFCWVAFRQGDDWVEYVYLQSSEAPAELIDPDEELRRLAAGGR